MSSFVYVYGVTKYHPDMAAAMTLDTAIAHCIRDASERHHLNATDISVYGRRVQWKSNCGGPIGEMVFRVPLRRFEDSIEMGVSDVSTLISFASLILQEENRGLAENIRTAVQCYGAPYYFQLIDNMYRVVAYIGIPSEGTYTAMAIDYSCNNETGEYTWEIPYSENIYANVQQPHMVDSDTDEPPSLIRDVSTYDAIGLHATQSSGLPIRGVSDSIREHSDYPDTPMAPPMELSDDSINTTMTDSIFNEAK